MGVERGRPRLPVAQWNRPPAGRIRHLLLLHPGARPRRTSDAARALVVRYAHPDRSATSAPAGLRAGRGFVVVVADRVTGAAEGDHAAAGDSVARCGIATGIGQRRPHIVAEPATTRGGDQASPPTTVDHNPHRCTRQLSVLCGKLSTCRRIVAVQNLGGLTSRDRRRRRASWRRRWA